MRRVATPASRGDHTYVLDSSLLASVTYSDHATLDLVFRNGAVYRYFAVPARVVEGLRTAPSLILYALGLLVYAYPDFDLPTLRLMGVLQRIAIYTCARANRLGGRPVGVEITASQAVPLERLNQLLASLGEPPLAEQDYRPLLAA